MEYEFIMNEYGEKRLFSNNILSENNLFVPIGYSKEKGGIQWDEGIEIKFLSPKLDNGLDELKAKVAGTTEAGGCKN